MAGSDSSYGVRTAVPFGAAGVLFLMLFAAVIGGAAMFYGQRYLATQTPSASPGENSADALAHRLTADEARLAILEKSQGASDPAIATALGARIDRLEQTPNPQLDSRLGVAETALAATRRDLDALSQNVPNLELRVGNLEKQDAAGIMRHAAGALALANLARAAETGGGFATELAILRTLMPQANEVKDLEPYAAQGAPTMAMLTASLPQSADTVLAAERVAHAGGWLGRLWANIANLIVIRRVGAVSGTDSESRLARAGARLQEGDLDAAVREMRALKGAARDAAQPWLKGAEARLAIERSLRSLANRLTQDLGAP